MGFIKNRIDTEYNKHKSLDWSKIAEAKILSEIKFLIDELDIEKFQGEYCFKANSFKKELKERLSGSPHS